MAVRTTPLTVRFTRLALLALAAWGAASAPLLAQPSPVPVVPNSPQADPNRARFPQPQPQPQPLPQPDPPLQPPAPTDQTAPTTASVAVRRVEVTGSSVFTEAQIGAITRPSEGQTLTRAEIISRVVAPITLLYLERGYYTSRAELVDIADGVVRVNVLEGTLARIEVQGTERLNPDYIRDRVRLGAGVPLNTVRLEEQLRLLRGDPLFTNIEASLRRAEEASQSILVVRVSEAPALSAGLSFDNYSPPAVGSERGVASLRYRNLTGIGDEVNLSYSVSTGAANIYDFIYRTPLNPLNGTLQLRISPNTIQITDPAFQAFGIRGNSELYELSLRQPLVRTLTEEFALSFAFAIQNGQTFLFNDTPFPFGIGPDASGVSRTNVFKFGQDYTSRDEGGAWALRSQFSLGAGILSATLNPDPIPDGRFLSWLGQVQRAQLLGDDNLLLFSTDVQVSFDPLLASQQFVIGGAQSIRGYRQNIRQGDNGFRTSVEARLPVARNEAGAPVFQVAPFVEGGGVWNVNGNPNLLPDQRFLITTGLGLLWEPIPRLNLRVDYGVPIIYLSDRGTNLQDNGFFFSLSYNP